MTSWEEYRREWVKRNACKFCGGNDLHTCLSYQCQEAVTTAGRYFDNVIKREEIKRMKRKYVTDLQTWFTEKLKAGRIVEGAWLISDDESKEIVIKFKNIMSKIERSMAVRLIEKRYAEDVIRVKAAGASNNFIEMMEGAVVREWKPGDGKIIMAGIPHEIKKGTAGQ